jgi:hypothetical protein
LVERRAGVGVALEQRAFRRGEATFPAQLELRRSERGVIDVV